MTPQGSARPRLARRPSGWPEDELAALRRLWASGLSAHEVMMALAREGFARTRNAVLGKIHRLGLEGGSLAGKPRQRRVPAAVRQRPPRENKPRENRPRRERGKAGIDRQDADAPRPERKPAALPPPVLGFEGAMARWPIAPGPAAVTLMEMKAKSCRWPLFGHDRAGGAGAQGVASRLYCGEPVEGAGSYCPACRARGYVRVSA